MKDDEKKSNSTNCALKLKEKTQYNWFNATLRIELIINVFLGSLPINSNKLCVIAPKKIICKI